MIWLQPWAFLGLILLAGPVIVHLLRRHHAKRILVPTTRFVPAVTAASVRLLRPSDLLVLLLRAGIVALAVVALAVPLLLTSGRVEGWNGRVARAVVVDTTASTRGWKFGERANAEVSNADVARIFEADIVEDGLKRAVAWLRVAPPARREIVVLSDFQHGALTARDMRGIPSEVGIRLLPAGEGSVPRGPAAADVLADGIFHHLVTALDGWQTHARYAPSGGDPWAGLRIEGATPDQTDALQRVVARAGVWAPSREQPIVIRFGPPESALRPGLPADASNRLLRFLESPAATSVPHRVGTRDDVPQVELDLDPGSLAAALALKAALDSLHDPRALRETEPQRMSAAELRALSREPGPVDGSLATYANETDSRWFWASVLVLLGVESLVRRRRETPGQEVGARAA